MNVSREDYLSPNPPTCSRLHGSDLGRRKGHPYLNLKEEQCVMPTTRASSALAVLPRATRLRLVVPAVRTSREASSCVSSLGACF